MIPLRRFHFFLPLFFISLPIFSILVSGKRVGDNYENRKSNLSHHAVLDGKGHFRLTWIKNVETKEIEFTVQVKTNGWFGFGISPNGGMINSDIVIGWIDDSGTTHFHDRFASSESLPTIDESQDWILLGSSQNETHMEFKFRRAWLTCDHKFDREISEGVTRLLWAYGDTKPVDDNSVPIHKSDKRGSRSMRLLMDDPGVSSSELESDIEVWDILSRKSRIPLKETTYYCSVVKYPFPEKRHVVKYDVVVQPGHEAFVHHLVLFRCQHPDPSVLADFLKSSDHECIPGLNNMPPDLLHCRSFYLIWTVGGGAFEFPKDVGLPLGGGTDDNSVFYMLEVHYDNTYLQKNIVDSSGFRLYTTKTLRKYDADNYVMGSAEDYRIILPPRQEEIVVVGHCSAECHEDVIPKDGINVMSVMVHAHLLATRIKARHFRGEIELEPLIDEKNYDFNYQDYWHYNKIRKILPGDQVTVECYYNTSTANKTTLGGFQTSEEMCHIFIAYYPRMADDRSCFSGLSPTTIATLAGIDELAPIVPEVDPTILSPLHLKNVKLSQYLANKTDWDDQLVKESLYLLRHAPRQTQCYYRHTDRIKSTSHMVGYPKKFTPYEQKVECQLPKSSGIGGGSGTLITVLLVLLILIVIGGIVVFFWKRRQGSTNSYRSD